MAVKCPSCHSENSDTVKFCGECGAPLPQLVSRDGKPGIPGDVRDTAEPRGQGPNSPASDTPPSNAKDLPAKVTETFRAPLKDLDRGTLFARRFEVIEELGKGGMGKVYRVFDKKIEDEIALKLIKPEIAADEETIRRFSNELRLARKITHRNVGKMFEIMEGEGAHFITMEYVPGENLKSMIRMSGQMGIKTALGIARQVCEGLSEAHRLGIVHRDLKPSNIMIDKEGAARILDFGVARSLSGKSITGAGMMIGTPEYMSPEQVEGEEVDVRSDLYSLGVILYEMVTGRRPFEGDSPLSVAHKQKYEAPQDPKSINLHASENLSRVILRCLEKDKTKRFQSAEELHSELTRLEEEIPTTDRAIPKKKPAQSKEIADGKGKTKRIMASLYLGAVVVLALFAYAAVHLFSSRSEVIDSIAVLPFENINADPNTDYLCDGITETVINKLSQLSGLKKVIARDSVFTYKGRVADARRVGEELGVKAVLMTRVVRLGDRLSISPALVRVKDRSQLWGEKYDRTFEDIFSIEENIAASIVQALRLKLTEGDRLRISERSIDNAAAYELYLRANHEIRRYREDSLDRVVRDLQNGLEMIGPNPYLYSALASAYIQYVNIGAKDEEYLARAEDFAHKALDLEPNFPKANIALGYLHEFRSPAEGIRYLKKALAANPNEPYALRRLALVYLGSGKPSAALPLIEKFKEVDPLNPDNHLIRGTFDYFDGRFGLSLDEYRKSYQSDPESPSRQYVYARTLACNKAFDEAISIIDQSAKANPTNAVTKAGILLKYGFLKDKDKAFEVMSPDFRKICRRDSELSYAAAQTFALLDERKEALDWLENAVDRGFINFPFLSKHGPFLESVRGEERFRKLMERVKYEWEHFEE